MQAGFLNFNDFIPAPRMFARAAVMDSADGGTEELNIDIRPIKLNYYIDTVFEIK